MRHHHTLALVVVLALLTACNAYSGASPPVTPQSYGGAAPPTCHSDGVTPDPLCTPGVPNPAVTQANIQSTICVPGYTKTIRPPVSYTSPLKVRQMAMYGFTDSISLHEEDHFIALTDGGSPTDEKNLWPGHFEDATHPLGMHAKDRLEVTINHLICNDTLTLAQGQDKLTHDWTQAFREYERAGALAPMTVGVAEPDP